MHNESEEQITIVGRVIISRSAELHSAVSQNCILQRFGLIESEGIVCRAADCKSAIQQIENLRYPPRRSVANLVD